MTNARSLSDHLADLLRREHHALAEFLVALADFDRRRLWEELGHANLFAFLHRELGLSRGSAFYRKVAAELVQRHPEVIEPLRDGRLCLTSVVELAKVLTAENRDEVLPRFFHRSKQEAKAISAELRPQEAPPRRDVVTSVGLSAVARVDPVETRAVPAPSTCSDRTAEVSRGVQPDQLVRANTLEPSRAVPPRPAPRDVAEPVTGDLRRLHVTVSRRFLDKLDAARDALSHARPGATTEEVLEAALDLLLAQRAKRNAAAVKTPRAAAAKPAKPESRHVPAAVRREVWARDHGRCQWRLEAGGICGSTHRLELDHVDPVAHGGPSTVGNVRILCERHNKLAARRVLGDEWMDRFKKPRGPELPSRRDATNPEARS